MTESETDKKQQLERQQNIDKTVQEQQANLQLAAQQQETLRKKQEADATPASATPTTQTQASTTWAPVESSATSSPKPALTDLQKLFKAYETNKGCSPKDGKTLTFDNYDDALRFFTNQAKDPNKLSFFCCEIGPKGPTGKHVFSCGDGKLYEGKLEDIFKELKAAQEKATKGSPEYAAITKGLETIGPHMVKQGPAQPAPAKPPENGPASHLSKLPDTKPSADPKNENPNHRTLRTP